MPSMRAIITGEVMYLYGGIYQLDVHKASLHIEIYGWASSVSFEMVKMYNHRKLASMMQSIVMSMSLPVHC